MKTSYFRYRDGWRVQVTLRSGQRVTKDAPLKQDCENWVYATYPNGDGHGHPALLGGPTKTTLAQMLAAYADRVTISKRGYRAEFNRLGHYFVAAGLPLLKLHVGPDNTKKLVALEDPSMAAVIPKGLQTWLSDRVAQRRHTAEATSVLANKRVSQITKADMQAFKRDMELDGLSPSTIQKEIALLKHAFNIAINTWDWFHRCPLLSAHASESHGHSSAQRLVE